VSGKKRADGTGCVYARRRKDGSVLGWWIKIYRSGEQIVRNAHTMEREEAKDQLVKLLAQKADGVPIARAQLTLKDAAANANRTAAMNGREPSRAYDKHLIPYFGKHAKMSAITTIRIKQYIEQKLTAGAAPATVNRQLEALRRAFTVALQDGALASRPHIPRLRENNVRTGFFERAQFDALCRRLPKATKKRPVTDAVVAADPLVQVATFGWITGWRLGEIVGRPTKDGIAGGLRWKNVDFANGVVRLDPGTTKNGDGREFAMTKALRSLLERRLAAAKAGKVVVMKIDRTGLVFTKKDGEPIGEFRKTWHRACRAAGIPDRVIRKADRSGKIVERRLPGLTFHDFRRTAVRRLVEEAGVSERVAMTMTGHRTRSVFDRYHIVSQRDQREAARRLDELDAAAASS
jgi:integrase